uniref:alpha/beta hydrolase n=1 Tax=Deinococcus sp. TaxID=47478 RepID=UPI0025D7ED84
MNIQTGILAAVLGLGMSAAQASSREVTLAVPSASLRATLSVPEGVAHPPVVLILAGSGPTDRDGNGPSGLSTDVYRKLAGALTAAGYAVLRPDKRGVGSSAATDSREEALTFSTYVQDAHAWLTWLGQQPELGKVAVIGHSEGALVGLAACLEPSTSQGAEPVGAYVSLAGAGDNIADTLRRQLRANPANPAALTSEADRIIASLRGGQ